MSMSVYVIKVKSAMSVLMLFKNVRMYDFSNSNSGLITGLRRLIWNHMKEITNDEEQYDPYSPDTCHRIATKIKPLLSLLSGIVSNFCQLRSCASTCPRLWETSLSDTNHLVKTTLIR